MQAARSGSVSRRGRRRSAKSSSKRDTNSSSAFAEVTGPRLDGCTLAAFGGQGGRRGGACQGRPKAAERSEGSLDGREGEKLAAPPPSRSLGGCPAASVVARVPRRGGVGGIGGPRHTFFGGWGGEQFP